MRDFAARFLGRRRNKKREVAESVIRDQPTQAVDTNSKKPPRNPSSPPNHPASDPPNLFQRQVLRFRKSGKRNKKHNIPLNVRGPRKTATAPIEKPSEHSTYEKTRHKSLPNEVTLGADRVVTFKEPSEDEHVNRHLGDNPVDSSSLPKPASPVKDQTAFAEPSPDKDNAKNADIVDGSEDGDDDGENQQEFFLNFTRRHADARKDLPSSPRPPSNHVSTQRPAATLRFTRRNRSNIPTATENSLNPGKPAERFFSDNGITGKAPHPAPPVRKTKNPAVAKSKPPVMAKSETPAVVKSKTPEAVESETLAAVESKTPAVVKSKTPANQTTHSIDSDQPLLETQGTNEMLKNNSSKTKPLVSVASKDRKNPMRSASLMSKHNVDDVDLQDLRASLSTPHLSVVKDSTVGNSNSFWFAERRKPRSRLLAAFPFRKSSKMFSDYEIPPSIANTPQIPWSVPGAMSDDDEGDAQFAHPSISNSFLSFRVFNNLRKNNSYVPATPLNSQDQFSVFEANLASENGNLKNGVRNILRFPFGGRRSPVPSAARKEATEAEDGFEKEISEKNERPSDISLHIPRMDDDITSFKSAVDPHEFDVDEYSSLHSAISAMLTQKSHVVARNEEDEMLMRHDIKLKSLSSKGILLEEEVPQIRAGVVRYKSTPRENPSACAFSGPVLAFSLLPSRPIEVPPAPLVYGPESTGWPDTFPDFSDPRATVQSFSLGIEPTTTAVADLDDRPVSPPKTPVLNLRTSRSPSDEALVPGNTSYVRVSSVGMISNESEKRLGLIDFSIDPVTRVRSNIVESESKRTNESMGDQVSVPMQSAPGIYSSQEASEYPVAVLMDESQDIAVVEPTPPSDPAETVVEDSPNMLVAPTLADVEKQVAETRKKSLLENVLLNTLKPSVLPDVVPLADVRSNGDDSLLVSGAVPTPSEPTFTTFSETSKDWGGSLEFASDVPSLSSNEMFVDAPSNLFKTARNGYERMELPHPAELAAPPSQSSAHKSPPLSTVIQSSKTQDRSSRLSKVGIVGPSPWRESKPVPRANTATVLSALPARSMNFVPVSFTPAESNLSNQVTLAKNKESTPAIASKQVTAFKDDKTVSAATYHGTLSNETEPTTSPSKNKLEGVRPVPDIGTKTENGIKLFKKVEHAAFTSPTDDQGDQNVLSSSSSIVKTGSVVMPEANELVLINLTEDVADRPVSSTREPAVTPSRDSGHVTVSSPTVVESPTVLLAAPDEPIAVAKPAPFTTSTGVENEGVSLQTIGEEVGVATSERKKDEGDSSEIIVGEVAVGTSEKDKDESDALCEKRGESNGGVTHGRVVLPRFVLATPFPVIEDIGGTLSSPVERKEEEGVKEERESEGMIYNGGEDSKGFDERDANR